MILTTHAITGAAVASIIPSHPVLGFTAGFVSHFLLDAIPHWDYDLISRKENGENPLDNDIIIDRNSFIDLFKIGCDMVLGITLSLILFGFPDFNLNSILSSSVLWGVAGGITPDALQFVYFKWKHEPMISLQKIHLWAHTKKELSNRPILGIFLQIILIIVVVSISKLVS